MEQAGYHRLGPHRTQPLNHSAAWVTRLKVVVLGAFLCGVLGVVLSTFDGSTSSRAASSLAASALSEKGANAMGALSKSHARPSAAQPLSHQTTHPTSVKRQKVQQLSDADENHKVDGLESISCDQVEGLMGPNLFAFAGLLLQEKGHCGEEESDSQPTFTCEAAFLEVLSTESVWLTGTCGPVSAEVQKGAGVWSIHIAKPEFVMDDESLEDPLAGDPDSELTYCTERSVNPAGSAQAEPRSPLEKLRCMFSVLEMEKVADSVEEIGVSSKLVSKLNKQKKTWEAKLYKKFATATKEQLRRRNGVRKPPTEVLAQYPVMAIDQATELDAYDFRKEFPEATSNRILNQGQCGSCYAFAATKMFSNTLYKTTGGQYDIELSNQQTVSCYVNFHGQADGCGGGWGGEVYLDMIEHGGYHTRRCLPYHGLDADDENGIPCNTSMLCQDDLHYPLAAWYTVRGTAEVDIEDALATALVKYGPLWVGFPIFDSFMAYHSGIYAPVEGDQYSGAHAAALIGFTNDSWIFANSWGEDWGENGFFRMARGNNSIIWHYWTYAVVPAPAESLQCHASPPCQNGGSYKEDCSCWCPLGHTGQRCETCSLQCYNGGVVNKEDCFCDCPQGTWGKQCEAQFTIQWHAWNYTTEEAEFKVEWSLLHYHHSSNTETNVIRRFSDDTFRSRCSLNHPAICGKFPITGKEGSMLISGVLMNRGYPHRGFYEHCYGGILFNGNNEFGRSKGNTVAELAPCVNVEKNDNFEGGKCLTGGNPIRDTSHPLFHMQCNPPAPLQIECENVIQDGVCDFLADIGWCEEEGEDKWVQEHCAKSCGVQCWQYELQA